MYMQSFVTPISLWKVVSICNNNSEVISIIMYSSVCRHVNFNGGKCRPLLHYVKSYCLGVELNILDLE